MASGPITSWEIDGETVKTVSDFIFLGSKTTADGDCSHEIKRRLLLGRKVMTNLHSILKSRDITLPKKAHLVKATLEEEMATDSSILAWRIPRTEEPWWSCSLIPEPSDAVRSRLAAVTVTVTPKSRAYPGRQEPSGNQPRPAAPRLVGRTWGLWVIAPARTHVCICFSSPDCCIGAPGPRLSLSGNSVCPP